jgi:hypothetical protein
VGATLVQIVKVEVLGGVRKMILQKLLLRWGRIGFREVLPYLLALLRIYNVIEVAATHTLWGVALLGDDLAQMHHLRWWGVILFLGIARTSVSPVYLLNRPLGRGDLHILAATCALP